MIIVGVGTISGASFIGPDERARAAEIVAYASKKENWASAAPASERPVLLTEAHRMVVPVGIECVFSVTSAPLVTKEAIISPTDCCKVHSANLEMLLAHKGPARVLTVCNTADLENLCPPELAFEIAEHLFGFTHGSTFWARAALPKRGPCVAAFEVFRPGVHDAPPVYAAKFLRAQ